MTKSAEAPGAELQELIALYRTGGCGDPCRVRDVASGCDCARVAAVLEAQEKLIRSQREQLDAIVALVDPPMSDGVWTGSVAEAVQAHISALKAAVAQLSPAAGAMPVLEPGKVATQAVMDSPADAGARIARRWRGVLIGESNSAVLAREIGDAVLAYGQERADVACVNERERCARLAECYGARLNSRGEIVAQPMASKRIAEAIRSAPAAPPAPNASASTRTKPLPPPGWVLVPADDLQRDASGSSLPDVMVHAGAEALDRCQAELRAYVSGATPDWDSGMIAVAIYRAMVAAVPSPTNGGEKGQPGKDGDCPACEGTGIFDAGDAREACANCDGTGRVIRETGHEA